MPLAVTVALPHLLALSCPGGRSFLDLVNEILDRLINLWQLHLNLQRRLLGLLTPTSGELLAHI